MASRSREQNQASDDAGRQDHRDAAAASKVVGGDGAAGVGHERQAEEHQERAGRETWKTGRDADFAAGRWGAGRMGARWRGRGWIGAG